jgi:hypothetical protein
MSPDSLEDFLTKTARVSAPWCEPTSSLPFSIWPSRPGDFFCENLFFSRIRDQYRVNRRCLLHPHFRAHVQLKVCSLGWVIESNTLRSVASACLSFAEPTNR